MAKWGFMAEIDVCTKRKIVRNIVIDGRRISPAQARRKALAEFNSMKADGRYVVLQQVGAVTGKDGTAYADRRISRVTKCHERFHRIADNNNTASMPLEESAAYAFQSTVALHNRREEINTAKEIRKYKQLARHSVRFLFAVTLAEPNGLLESSMAAVKRHSSAIAGDSRAIAFNYAKDYMLYLECLEIVRQWGVKDARKIFLEAIGMANEKGLHGARAFLLRQLPPERGESIDAAYGIDLRGFRFTSPYASNAACEDLVW